MRAPTTINIEQHQDAKPITADQLCRCITGLDMHELAKDIIINTNGKYDFLFKK